MMIRDIFDWMLGNKPEPEKADPGDYIIRMGPGGQQVVESLDNLAHRPQARKAQVTLNDLDSFAAYVLDYKEPATAVFFDPDRGATAVIDYISKPPLPASDEADERPLFETPELPRPTSRYEHRASMPLDHTAEYTAWKKALGAKFEQQAFAEFLERRALDIVSPPAADLIPIVETLEETQTLRFGSRVNRHNGMRSFQFTTENKAGELKVPEKLRIRIKIYTCSPEPVEVECLLRYRVPTSADATGLVFFYECPQLEALVEKEAAAIREELLNRLPDTPVLTGSFLG